MIDLIVHPFLYGKILMKILGDKQKREEIDRGFNFAMLMYNINYILL